MQQILVDIIVIAAALFVGRMIYRSVAASRRAKRESACAGCGACDAAQAAKPKDSAV